MDKFDLQRRLLDVVLQMTVERAGLQVARTGQRSILLFVDSLWLVAGGGMEMSNLRCVVSAVGGAPASLRLPRRPAAKLGKRSGAGTRLLIVTHEPAGLLHLALN